MKQCHMYTKDSWQRCIQNWHFINTLRPRQNGRHFADDTFKRIFLDENARVSIRISVKFVLKGPIDNIPALVQIMAWRQSGDKPLSEPMMVNSLTHICITWPQWINLHDIIVSLYHEQGSDTYFSAFLRSWTTICPNLLDIWDLYLTKVGLMLKLSLQINLNFTTGQVR